MLNLIKVFLVLFIVFSTVISKPTRKAKPPDDFMIKNLKIIDLMLKNNTSHNNNAHLKMNVRKTATMGLLLGAIQTEGKMERQLLERFENLQKDFDNMDELEVFAKVAEIERKMQRDRRAMRILNNALCLAMNGKTVDEYRKSLAVIAAEDAKSRQEKKSKLQTKVTKKDAQKKMQKLKMEMTEHLKSMRNSLSETAKEAVDFLDPIMKGEIRINFPVHDDFRLTTIKNIATSTFPTTFFSEDFTTEQITSAFDDLQELVKQDLQNQNSQQPNQQFMNNQQFSGNNEIQRSREIFLSQLNQFPPNQQIPQNQLQFQSNLQQVNQAYQLQQQQLAKEYPYPIYNGAPLPQPQQNQQYQSSQNFAQNQDLSRFEQVPDNQQFNFQGNQNFQNIPFSGFQENSVIPGQQNQAFPIQNPAFTNNFNGNQGNQFQNTNFPGQIPQNTNFQGQIPQNTNFQGQIPQNLINNNNNFATNQQTEPITTTISPTHPDAEIINFPNPNDNSKLENNKDLKKTKGEQKEFEEMNKQTQVVVNIQGNEDSNADDDDDEEFNARQNADEGGGIIGLIASLSGGEEGSDVGALIGAISGIVTNLFGPDGLDIPSLISTGTSLIAGLLGGEENFGTVLGGYVGTAVEGLSGGGADQNGAFFGNLLGTIFAQFSSDPDDDDNPPNPFLFLTSFLDTFLSSQGKNGKSDENADGDLIPGSSAFLGFISNIVSSIVGGITSFILNAALGASSGSSQGSADLSAGASGASSSGSSN